MASILVPLPGGSGQPDVPTHELLPQAFEAIAQAFYRSPARRGWRTRALRIAERGLDILVSLVALIVLAPIFLILVLVVRLTSPGPAMYRQVRIGRGGRPFLCLKFRSMHPEADRMLWELLASSAELRQEFALTQKLKSDPRVTRIGRFLRKTSLDELPQLLNVLRGDMGLVGPRPVVPIETIRYGGAITKVLEVRPGLTGPWQVSGRNELSYEERVTLDLAYAERHSFLTNIVVLFKTVLVLLRPRSGGAF